MRAYVEVDEIRIANGPGLVFFRSARSTFSENSLRTMPCRFTATTAASEQTFIATVRVHVVDQREDGNWWFSGEFQGKLVEGTFNVDSREGLFRQISPTSA